jgi:outer membrane protein assembly factor BamB
LFHLVEKETAMKYPRLAGCTAVALLVWVSTSAAQEWTRFRGPNGTGLSDCKTIPVQWTDADIRFKVRLPAAGHSSPVLWGDKLFLTGADDDATAQRSVFCLDARDGRLLWEKRFDSKYHTKHKFNSFASSTPAVDEHHVYVCWSTPEQYTLMALDHQGSQVWRLDLGPVVSQHSTGISPIVYEDLVILGNDQDDEGGGISFIVAVDRMTGQQRWKVDRRSERVAYSTPCIYQPQGSPPQLIFNSQAHGISSFDPRTGRLLWEIATTAPDAPLLTMRSVSSSLLAGDYLIASCGSGAGGNYLVAVKPGTPGRENSAQLAYKVTRDAPYVPTPIAYNGLLFLVADKGVASCVDANSGEVYWTRRLGGNFFGSPVCVDGKLYCVSVDGQVVVLAADKQYQHLASYDLGDLCHSTPAVAHGRMYIRTYNYLFAIGGP